MDINNGVIQGTSINGVPFSAMIINPSGKTNVRTLITLKDLIGITVHNTGNSNETANARAHYNWLNGVEINDSSYVSVHFFVDENEIVQTCPLNEITWHAGDGNGNGNYKTISIEICENGDELKAEENAIKLVQALRGHFGEVEVYKHQDWSGKYCPRVILGRNGWNEFKAKCLNKTVENSSTSTTTSQLYRVRKSWKDASSQIGAYSNLDNAKNACTDGYYVFDINGNIVYPTTSTPSTPVVVVPTYAYKVGDNVTISTHYVGNNDTTSKAVGVSPWRNITIVRIDGGVNPYYTTLGTYINDGDIRGYWTEEVVEQKPVSENLVLKFQQTAIADGYTFPKFGADGKWGSECVAVATRAVIKKGSKGNLAKLAQQLVINNGFSCGSSGADGNIGNGSISGFKSWQSANGLVADGCIGLKSWCKLLNV